MIKPKRIRTYLFSLVAACGLGGFVLFTGMSRLDQQHDQATSFVTEDRLGLRDIERFDALFTQWILISDLVLGSDQTYATQGARQLGAGLAQLCEDISHARITQNHPDAVDVIRTFVARQNDRLDTSAELMGDNRMPLLRSLLDEMDDESGLASEAIEELKMRGTQLMRWDEIALSDVSAWRGFLRGLMLSGFLVYVAILWRWSSRTISRPVMELSREAGNALRENRRMIIHQAGPIEMRQLTHSMLKLVGSLENQVEERTKHLEAALQEAQGAAQAKSNFLANMSHEIRTPMTAVIGFSEQLRDEPDVVDDPVKRSETVDAIVQNGHHLLNLIDGILDLSLIESGKLELELTDVCPFQQAQDAMSSLKMQAVDKTLRMELECAAAIPSLIQSDPARIQQILVNLIGNAIKFTSAGHVRVTLSVNGKGDTLWFEIQDTGIGIDAEAMQRLFKPFEQADSSMSRQFGGTGLGLSLSQNFAVLLGGDIVCESEQNVGSTFTFSHPCDARTPRERPEAWSFDAEDAAKENAVPVKSLRVLVVEDNQMNQILAESLLVSSGAEVSLASDGEEGYKAATAAVSAGAAFDVILMDMQMPIMDGYKATAKLREDGYPGVIIALTGHAMAHDRQKCINAGCDDYTTKPIDRDLLFKTMDRCLQARQTVLS